MSMTSSRKAGLLDASSRLSVRPVDRSSTASTSQPLANKRSTSVDPMNPAPPVTTPHRASSLRLAATISSCPKVSVHRCTRKPLANHSLERSIARSRRAQRNLQATASTASAAPRAPTKRQHRRGNSQRARPLLTFQDAWVTTTRSHELVGIPEFHSGLPLDCDGVPTAPSTKLFDSRAPKVSAHDGRAPTEIRMVPSPTDRPRPARSCRADAGPPPGVSGYRLSGPAARPRP